VDEALYYLLEETLIAKEEWDPLTSRKRKQSVIVSNIETFKKKSSYEKMRVILNYVIIVHSVSVSCSLPLDIEFDPSIPECPNESHHQDIL